MHWVDGRHKCIKVPYHVQHDRKLANALFSCRDDSKNKASGIDDVIDRDIEAGHGKLRSTVNYMLHIPQALKNVKRLPPL